MKGGRALILAGIVTIAGTVWWGFQPVSEAAWTGGMRLIFPFCAGMGIGLGSWAIALGVHSHRQASV